MSSKISQLFNTFSDFTLPLTLRARDGFWVINSHSFLAGSMFHTVKNRRTRNTCKPSDHVSKSSDVFDLSSVCLEVFGLSSQSFKIV